jgi:hypothetical protein
MRNATLLLLTFLWLRSAPCRPSGFSPTCSRASIWHCPHRSGGRWSACRGPRAIPDARLCRRDRSSRGLVTGALVLRQTSCDELDCLAPAFYGGLAGLSIGAPSGVHLANGRRGRSWPALAASLAIGAAGLGAAILVEEPRLLLAIPVLQIASSISIEAAAGCERP